MRHHRAIVLFFLSFSLAACSPLGSFPTPPTGEDTGGNDQPGGSMRPPSGAGGSPAAPGSGPAPGAGSPAPTGGYHVVGNQVLDANGSVHRFLGLARPSLEWSPTGEHISAADFQAIASWKANVVRVPLNQDFWLPGAHLHDPSYPSTIDSVVQMAEAAGMDVILDLHWSDRGDLQNGSPGQQRMADANSVTFWTQVASRYKDDPRVLFELYNEPHDVSWDVWLHGGPSGDGFTVAGMQQLYDTVRAAGAPNVVIIGGLNYAYDLSGVPTHRVVGSDIVYNTHPYNFGGKQPGDWDSGFGFLAATDPLIATEFGDFDCSTGYYSQLITYMSQKQISFTGWAWYPGGCGFPAVIADWSGAPNSAGQLVKSALAMH
jgi:hypothetical protein